MSPSTLKPWRHFCYITFIEGVFIVPNFFFFGDRLECTDSTLYFHILLSINTTIMSLVTKTREGRQNKMTWGLTFVILTDPVYIYFLKITKNLKKKMKEIVNTYRKETKEDMKKKRRYNMFEWCVKQILLWSATSTLNHLSACMPGCKRKKQPQYTAAHSFMHDSAVSSVAV